MRLIFALAALMLAAVPAGAQQTGAWRVTCASGACTASETARGAAPIAMHLARGFEVSIDGASFNASGVMIFAFNGMQTTFFPIAPYLRDGGRRVAVGPNEISDEIVRQASSAKRITVSLPLIGGERRVDFDPTGFAAAAAKVRGR